MLDDMPECFVYTYSDNDCRKLLIPRLDLNSVIAHRIRRTYYPGNLFGWASLLPHRVSNRLCQPACGANAGYGAVVEIDLWDCEPGT
jgi:hypothetical protein